MVHRFILRADTDCESCGCPLMAGEVAYRDDRTGSLGHSRECCEDRAGEIEDHREHTLFLSGFEADLIGGAA